MKLGHVTGVLLAGGKSTRMGRDKMGLMGARALAVLRECFEEVLVVQEDDVPGIGPLGGILTALRATKTEVIFVAACDMPFLDAARIRELVGQLGEFDAVVPRVGDRFEPLHAVYHRRVLPVVEEQVRAGEYSLQRFVSRLNAKVIASTDWGRSLFNVNTPADWAAVQEK